MNMEKAIQQLKDGGIKGLIFDMDGTLVHNMHFHQQAWLAFLEKHGINVSEEEFWEKNAGTITEIVPRFFDGLTDEADDEAPKGSSKKFDAQVALFTGYLKDIAGQNMNGGWLLSHHPVWSIKQGNEALSILNAALEAAWAQAKPTGIGLLVAGHTHTFELIEFSDSHPAQLVIGNGGTSLAKSITSYSKNDPVVKENQIQSFNEDHQWGYSIFTGKAGNWKISVENENAHKDLTCKIQGAKAACKK